MPWWSSQLLSLLLLLPTQLLSLLLLLPTQLLSLLLLLPSQLLLSLRRLPSRLLSVLLLLPSLLSSSLPSPSLPSPFPSTPLLPLTHPLSLPSPYPLPTHPSSPLISTSQINPLSLTLLLPSSRSSVAPVLLPSLFLFLSLSLPDVLHLTLLPFFLHTLTPAPSLTLAFSSLSHKPPPSSHSYLYNRLPSFVSSRFFLLHLSSYSASNTQHITLLTPSPTSGTDYVIRNSPSSLYNTLLRSLLNTVTTYTSLPFLLFFLFFLFYTLTPTPSAPPPLALRHTYSTLPSFYSSLRSLLILN